MASSPRAAATIVAHAATSGRALLSKTYAIFSGTARAVSTFGSMPAMSAAQYYGLALQNPTVATAVVTIATVAMSRLWASAVSLAMLAVLLPQLREYHQPAAATALLVTLGASVGGLAAESSAAFRSHPPVRPLPAASQRPLAKGPAYVLGFLTHTAWIVSIALVVFALAPNIGVAPV